jgi:hypothetical protein
MKVRKSPLKIKNNIPDDGEERNPPTAEEKLLVEDAIDDGILS